MYRFSSCGCSLPFDRPCLLYEKPPLHSPLFPSGRKCVILAIRHSGSQHSGAPAMDYDELVAEVIELLQREKRVPYRSLKRRFDLDDDYIEDLKIDLIEAKRLAVDEHDRILVWVGEQASPPPALSPEPVPAAATDQEREPLSYTPKHLAEKILTSRSALEGERKQVTVLFCDLANSTLIAERLGPEHMHTLLNRF